jgi:hypothetical protein
MRNVVSGCQLLLQQQVLTTGESAATSNMTSAVGAFRLQQLLCKHCTVPWLENAVLAPSFIE